eukprot:1345979-Amorphochlora_amoeboformis.AAC.1
MRHFASFARRAVLRKPLLAARSLKTVYRPFSTMENDSSTTLDNKAENDSGEISRLLGLKWEDLTIDQRSLLRDRAKDMIFTLLEEKGPLRLPQIWAEVKDSTNFVNRTHFDKFINGLHRQKVIKGSLVAGSARFHYKPYYPSEWEVKLKMEGEPDIGETTWQTLLPEDPVTLEV